MVDFTKDRTEKEIIDRWTSLGFLDGIKSEELITIICYTFEYAAQELINGNYNKRLDMLTFPIIRLLLTNHNDKKTLKSQTSHIEFNRDKIKDYVKNVILKLNRDVNVFDFDIKIEDVDIEADFCTSFKFDYVWK